MVTALMHTATQRYALTGGLSSGIHQSLCCMQKGTYGLLLATDEQLSYVLLACPAHMWRNGRTFMTAPSGMLRMCAWFVAEGGYCKL